MCMWVCMAWCTCGVSFLFPPILHVGSGNQNFVDLCVASTFTCWVISLPGNTFYLINFLRNKEALSDQRFLEKIYCLCVCTVYVYHAWAGAQEGQKRALDPRNRSYR